MGLTVNSVGRKAMSGDLEIVKKSPDDKIIALAGNPNVGKSTVFNNLTGMNQHTGNWPGKTVTNAQGFFQGEKHSYVMVDIPGTYSLMAHSTEEEIARNFICFGKPDIIVVVCDATCLERNLNLVLQTLEITDHVIVCLNLMDEAKRKRIQIDIKTMEEKLGVPVVATIARKKKSLKTLIHAMDEMVEKQDKKIDKINLEEESQDEECQDDAESNHKYDQWDNLVQMDLLNESEPVVDPFAYELNAMEIEDQLKLKKTVIHYPSIMEEAIALVEPYVCKKTADRLDSRWLSLKLLDQNPELLEEIKKYLGEDILEDTQIQDKIKEAQDYLRQYGVNEDRMKDVIVSSIVSKAEVICKSCVRFEKTEYDATDRKIDRVLTSRWAGYPIMLALLAVVFWITITGANYPSQWISNILFWFQDRLTDWFHYMNAPEWLHGSLVLGVYRVLAWVVSVMLPPMAIFFPLFTLLEDAGYLPRVAYNLDRPFKRCMACGKQALTMCMGFGCNAAGIVGCRIIDSPREKLLAMITNNFVPCNGRFPTLIAILTMFFVGTSGSLGYSVLSAILLTGVILLGIVTTFLVTKLLSMTLLKGVPSSFTLELPPYRKPQIGKVIVRSIFDRTLFVLKRAVVMSVPAGLVIWIMANIVIGDLSLLNHCAQFLDPFAHLLGLDGVILIAFILGFPANEIVVPIIIMAYMAEGSILEIEDLSALKQLLVQNGWTWITAISTMLFSLMHWPCSTTLLTIQKETGSFKWTMVSLLIPTVIGIVVCFLFASLARML